eukprot:SAG22_NODE_35_length_27276_cov_20.395849_14_plen_216_part_00
MIVQQLADKVLGVGEAMAARQPNGSLPAGLTEKTRYANARLALETSAAFLAALEGGGGGGGAAAAGHPLALKLVPRLVPLAAGSCGPTVQQKAERRAATAALLNVTVVLLGGGAGADSDAADQADLAAAMVAAIAPFVKAEVHSCLTSATYAADPAALTSALSALGNILVAKCGGPSSVAAATMELLQDLTTLQGMAPPGARERMLLDELLAALS